MVLKMSKLFFHLCLSASLLAATSSLASGFTDKVVTGAKCPLKLANYAKKVIQKTSKMAGVGEVVRFKSMAGQKFYKLTFSKKTKIILIQYPLKTKNYYFGDSACLFGNKKNVAGTIRPAPTPVAAGGARSSVSTTPTKHLLFSEVALSVQTFKTVGTLKFPAKPSAQMQAQAMGIMAESGYRLCRGKWEWALSGGGFLGTGELGKSLLEDQGSMKGITYKASSVLIFGGHISPAVFFRPSSKSVSVGIKLPISWVKTNWPVPPDPGYNVLPRSTFAGSLLLETRLERDRFTVIQNVGFYKKWGAISWAMGIGYQL